MFSEWSSAVAMSKLLYKPQQVLLPICSSREVYDENAKKCRKKITTDNNNIKCNNSETYIPEMNKCYKGYTSGIKVIPNKKNFKVIDLSEMDLAKKTCKNPRKYYRHEYTVNGSAVVIKKTGELLKKGDYFTNKTANETVYVCGQWRNCSGQWLTVSEEEFVLLKNQSIFVNVFKKLYDRSKYAWYNDSEIVLCGDGSQQVKTTRRNTSCVGTWVLIEDDEFVHLQNDSIYVNTSRIVYPPLQYIWQERTLFVCMKLSATRTEAFKDKNDDVLALLTIVGMSISIISLVFVLVTYSLFSELRTPPGINLMNLSVSIFLAQLLWLVGSGQTDKPMTCTAIAVLLHYFFLVSFVWTSIIAFDTWRAFTSKGSLSWSSTKRKKVMHSLKYMAIGWLSVMVYVAICVALDHSNTLVIEYGSYNICWIANGNAKLYFFGVPIGLVIIFNTVFFSMTVKAIKETQNQANLANENTSARRDFGMYVRIASVMGFTWAFGFAAPFGWVFLAYVFVILNSLQGVYIAIAFALSKRARKLYVKLWCPKQPSSKDDSGAVSTHVTSRNGRSTETVGHLPDQKTAV